MCQGFVPLSKETYIGRVPIGELVCGTKINKDLYLLSYA
ncbi:transposase [Bacillus sp. IT-79MI2]|nr:hypothetical protein BTH41_04968 [Bacillus mycoides]